MSSDEELAAWLRAAITARLALAREAVDEHAEDEAWRYDEQARPVPRIIGTSWESSLTDGVWNCEDPDDDCRELRQPSRAAGEHIAANDPRDTIARCEAELAILDEHAPVADYPPESIAEHRARGWPEYQLTMMAAMVYCARCHVWVDDAREDESQCNPVGYPCKTVRLLGHGYRHRPGYRAEWAPKPG